MNFTDIVREIRMERDRQDAKFGAQRSLDPPTWSAILGEEVGEVCKAVLDLNHPEIRMELIQVAAVAFNWLESMDREPTNDDHTLEQQLRDTMAEYHCLGLEVSKLEAARDQAKERLVGLLDTLGNVETVTVHGWTASWHTRKVTNWKALVADHDLLDKVKAYTTEGAPFLKIAAPKGGA